MSLPSVFLPVEEFATPEYARRTGIEFLGRGADADGIGFQALHADDLSELSPTRHGTQAAIADWNRRLAENPGWPAPRLASGKLDMAGLNPASAWFYATSPAMVEWRESAPSALTLTNIYFPEAERLVGDPRSSSEMFSGALVDDHARAIFSDGLDTIGVRTRARVLRMIAARQVLSGAGLNWVSLASGAAIPVLESLAEAGGSARMHLIDFDPAALEFATRLARLPRYAEAGEVITYNRNLIHSMILSDSLVVELGENSADLVDMIGIFEYFTARHAAKLLRNAFRLLRPGGTLVLANMRTTHTELHMNVRGCGWPHLIPRTLGDIDRIIAAADIGPVAVERYVPEDGVYAVVAISRP